VISDERRAKHHEAAQQALNQAHYALKEAGQRLEFLVRVNRRLAEDEEALLEIILELPLERARSAAIGWTG
jgi:hypothetical protein